MLINIKQNNTRFLPIIQKYGCLFLCFAHASPVIFSEDDGIDALNALWKQSKAYGYIDDKDDVVNHNGMLVMFGLSDLHYDDSHHESIESIPDKVKLVFGRFSRGEESGSHFVILNNNKVVTFDSFGTSRSVAEGCLKDMRWYYAD